MNENYCHLINVTNVIISYTSNGSIPNIYNYYFSNCKYINRLDLCELYNYTFLSIEVIPIYRKIVELLKTSIELNLDCNNKIISENRISRLKSSNINYYHVLYCSIVIIILFNLIIFYKNKMNKLK
jgi:hypothetical protein